MTCRVARAGLVNGPEQVEHRTDADCPAGGRRVLHRAVKHRCEQKSDADFLDATRDLLGGQLELHPRGLEKVGAAAVTRNRAVAVLCNARARARRNDRAGGGDVERALAVAAGAAGVHQIVVTGLDLRRVIAA